MISSANMHLDDGENLAVKVQQHEASSYSPAYTVVSLSPSAAEGVSFFLSPEQYEMLRLSVAEAFGLAVPEMDVETLDVAEHLDKETAACSEAAA